MMDFFKALFAPDRYMPHIHCFEQDTGLTWLHVLSDSLIGLSYVAISATLVYMVHRARRDIPFHTMFLAFGTFIIACGGTHFMEVVTLWHPTYWLSGGVKAVTAIASVTTAVVLPPLVPLALGMIHSARVSEQRRTELEEAHEELNRLYERLKEFDELKTEFFANVSHELRTPLALVLGTTERLQAGAGLSPDQQRDLGSIARNGRTLLRHVNDLLDVAKLAAGEMQARFAQVDLARLVRLVAGNFETLAEGHRIRFSVETPETVPAQVDPDKLQRVLLNLLANAFKFTPEGGVIRCVLTVEKAEAVIRIHDSGPGVPDELREAIFERFRQAEGGSTRQFGGTGLGLAIVRDFIELHGGTAAVDASPEGGALFTVRLPLEAPAGAVVESTGVLDIDDASRSVVEDLSVAVAPGEAVAAETEAAPRGTEPRERPVVLVVEDNPEMNRFISETLADEYDTMTATDGQEGLERARERAPDLILSDVMMPRMSGDQLAREVRRHPELNDVPIVLLTAREDDELRVRMLREGVQDYVTKPFSADELRARIRNLVTMKRTREILGLELAGAGQDLETLVRELAARRRELQTALETAEVARDHAERASQVKTNFLRLVSHELRTPLTAQQLQLQLLERNRETPLTPRQEGVVRRLAVSSQRLQELVESLLEYSRLESGRLTTHVETLEPAAVAGEVVDELRPRAEEKGLDLRLTVAAELPPLRSDPRLLRVILSNLVDNAVKYTEQGRVEVALAWRDGEHHFSVSDTGPGIPPDQHALIFEPFEQLEPVRRKHTPGVGLGLALVKDLVEALGGQIRLRSEVGAGSTFTVSLPQGASL